MKLCSPFVYDVIYCVKFVFKFIAELTLLGTDSLLSGCTPHNHTCRF